MNIPCTIWLIKRASIGRYYKPKQSVFGELQPGEDQLLKPYLFQKGKGIAYVTGTSLHNKMRLTTQVPKNIKVASRDKRIITKVGSVAVKAVKSYVDVTDDNYYILEILDAIKDFKDIPDVNSEVAVKRLEQKINELNQDDKRKLISTSLKYPPRVRALTGALLIKVTKTGEKVFITNFRRPFQLKLCCNLQTFTIMRLTLWKSGKVV